MERCARDRGQAHAARSGPLDRDLARRKRYRALPILTAGACRSGTELPLGTTNLWAFFDSSYRIRADVDYLARRWRQTGTSVLHVAAWHNMEPDPAQDEYLKKLIEACHRHAILGLRLDRAAARERKVLGRSSPLA